MHLCFFFWKAQTKCCNCKLIHIGNALVSIYHIKFKGDSSNIIWEIGHKCQFIHRRTSEQTMLNTIYARSVFVSWWKPRPRIARLISSIFDQTILGISFWVGTSPSLTLHIITMTCILLTIPGRLYRSACKNGGCLQFKLSIPLEFIHMQIAM